MTSNELFYLMTLAGLIASIWAAGAVYSTLRRRNRK